MLTMSAFKWVTTPIDHKPLTKTVKSSDISSIKERLDQAFRK